MIIMAGSSWTTIAVVYFAIVLSLGLYTNAAGGSTPSLTLIAENMLDPTIGFISLSAKMIPISSGDYRLCVGGVATTGSVGMFVSRDITPVGTIPTNTSEIEPKLPSAYTTVADVSAMDSTAGKCFYSVLHTESATTSSYAIVQADATATTNSIPLNSNILTINITTSQTYLIDSSSQTLTTAFNSLSISSVTGMCGVALSSTTAMYAIGRKSASVQIGFNGQPTSIDVTYDGLDVTCDAYDSVQWVVCYSTETALSTVGCQTNTGINKLVLSDLNTISLNHPRVAYLNSNTAAVVVQAAASSYYIVVVDNTNTELLRYESETLSYGHLVADAMNNVLSVVFNNMTGVYVRTYLFDQGTTPSTTPDALAPFSAPTKSSGPVSETAPNSAPVSVGPSGENSPSAALGTGPTPSDTNAVGADVLGPAIAIPLAAVGAGVFLLIFFLRKKKKRANKKKGDDDLDGGKDMTIINPTADQGRYSAIVGASKDDGINPTAIQPSEIDKRMHIPYKSLLFTKEIGAGSYGKVFVGEWRGAKVAIKVNNAITDIEGFLGEAKLTLGITPHPNLVQTFGVSLDGPNPCIVLEFCGGGSLDTIVFDREKHVTSDQKQDYALKIAYGLLHLHNNNIIHRDLAARNILLTNDGQPKISDFGMSRIVQEESSQGKTKASFGPIRWMAPESLKDKSYSTKSDVWSYGILLYELVAGNEPHADEDQLSIAVRIRDEAVTPVIPEDCDPVLKQVMEMCWKRNPSDRPSMEEVADFLRSH